jgi:hypothetical protein
MRYLLRVMNLSCLLGLFSCVMPPRLARGPDPRADLARRVAGKPELAVLFVGNSYSFGVPKAFAKVAAEHGKVVRVGHSTYGRWTLRRHSTHEPTLRKIRAGNWDVVVLQEQSEIPAKIPIGRNFAMFPPLRVLVTEVREAGALPVLYQTWGRRDRFMGMNARLRAGYRAAAENAGGLLVVPVGDAWEAEVVAGRGAKLFMEDGSHPTAVGNALSARVFYETLFMGN